MPTKLLPQPLCSKSRRKLKPYRRFKPFLSRFFFLERLVINRAGLYADRMDDEGRIRVVHALLQKSQDAFLRSTYNS